jgi:hypothetical protein
MYPHVRADYRSFDDCKSHRIYGARVLVQSLSTFFVAREPTRQV